MDTLALKRPLHENVAVNGQNKFASKRLSHENIAVNGQNTLTLKIPSNESCLTSDSPPAFVPAPHPWRSDLQSPAGGQSCPCSAPGTQPDQVQQG